MEYHKDTEKISKSGLDLINRSPLHYWDRYLNPDAETKQTPAMLLGSAVHCRVLEPFQFAERYAIAPKVDKRTKEGKATWEAFVQNNLTRDVISQDDSELIEKMTAAIHGHDKASILIDKITEVEKIYTHDDMKCRPDALTSLNIVLDLKTTEDASPIAFGRSAYKYRYDVQAAFYTDILEANNIKVEGFVFIAVEKTPPYAVGVYVIEDEDMARGREKYMENLKLWRECKASNKWDGYGMGKLMLPNYGK